MSIYKGMDRDQFCKYIEDTVKQTISDHDLIQKDDKLLVAVSGGKDSQVLLSILTKLGYQVDALLINEGIHNYREHTIKDMKELCAKLNVHLSIASFKEEMGKDLDVMLKDKKITPCTLCGTFRRYLLNKYAKNYDKIATGHNLDDEAQAILMNITTNQVNILPRLGPMTGTRDHEGFTRRIKPLYFITEKEVRLYAFLNKLNIAPGECPNVRDSFRGQIRDWLNEKEQHVPGTKKNIITWFLDQYPKLLDLAEQQEIQTCTKCGEPSYGAVCKACILKKEYADV